jgi:hypothetical protein
MDYYHLIWLKLHKEKFQALHEVVVQPSSQRQWEIDLLNSFVYWIRRQPPRWGVRRRWWYLQAGLRDVSNPGQHIHSVPASSRPLVGALEKLWWPQGLVSELSEGSCLCCKGLWVRSSSVRFLLSFHLSPEGKWLSGWRLSTVEVGDIKVMFAYRVESANLHLYIDCNQLNIWVCRTGLGIGLHLAKCLLERKD